MRTPDFSKVPQDTSVMASANPDATLSCGLSLYTVTITRTRQGYTAAPSEQAALREGGMIWDDNDAIEGRTDQELMSYIDLRDLCAPGYGHENDPCYCEECNPNGPDAEDLGIKTITDFLRYLEAEWYEQNGGQA